MSVEQNQQQLGQAYSSQNPVIQNGASTANQYTEMLKSGQITKDEYIQLMKDIQNTTNITEAMNDLANLETLNIAINGLISAASLLG